MMIEKRTKARTLLVAAGALSLSATFVTAATAQPAHKPAAKPTIVLVHGAFADGSSWSGVTRRLQHDGYKVVAPANPLRGLTSDAGYVASVVKSVRGPVILVGHSYGGMIISQIAASVPNVKALVYVAAFIPKAGESAGQLNSRFPGSLLGPATTRAIAYPGGTDLYVKPEAFHKVFAGDLSVREAAVAAAQQRPVDASALGDKAALTAPRGIPAYALVAAQDKAIPPAAQLFMAKRAGARIVQVRSAHDLPFSHPKPVAAAIERAAR